LLYGTSKHQFSWQKVTALKIVKTTLLLTFFQATLLICGCGKSKDGLFKRLVTEKEANLKQLLDKTGQHERTACRDLRSSVEGDTGFMEFNYFNEIDGSSAGFGFLRTNIGWKARYNFKDGKWMYDSSERQVWDLNGQFLGWVPGDGGQNEITIEILRVLK
jgi:hypothetical protein